MEKLRTIDRIHQIHGGPFKRKKKQSKMGGRPQLKGVVLKVSFDFADAIAFYIG